MFEPVEDVVRRRDALVDLENFIIIQLNICINDIWIESLQPWPIAGDNLTGRTWNNEAEP